ncbi:MAG: hypothetical protein Q9159_004681 [Coniocarpon cinnabarinum]
MPSGISAPTSTSGITEDVNGESIIPSSTRADGSVRKEIRVRPGYKPPEDVAVYKNRTAQAFKIRAKSGIPGAEFVESEKPKSAKKQHAQKTVDMSKESALKSGGKGVDSRYAAEPAPEPEPEPEDPELVKQKEARKLSKKLRQARELQQKNKEDGAALLPEQFAKVTKINELIYQLDKLGFDQDGQRKQQDG